MSIPIKKINPALANNQGRRTNLNRVAKYAVLGLVGTGIAGCEIFTCLRPKEKPAKVSELKTNHDKRNKAIEKLLYEETKGLEK